MEPTEHNRRVWDELHRRRTEILGAELRLPDVVRRSLASLEGKRVLHLQCGTGEETIELAALGATVTGVDISDEALETARERAPSVLWVQADVQRLPAELRRGRFDLAYSSVGSVPWLDDLDAWARGVADALRGGGDFLLYEEHPVTVVVDPFLRWQHDYFDESGERHERFWRLGQIVTAAARGGLAIRALEEYPVGASGRRLDRRVPATFLLHARKAG